MSGNCSLCYRINRISRCTSDMPSIYLSVNFRPAGRLKKNPGSPAGVFGRQRECAITRCSDVLCEIANLELESRWKLGWDPP
jgi:hypothetical protein